MRDEWYVARRGQDGNKRYGPVPLRQLRELMDSGRVQGEDLVWREGMAAWQAADQCPELAAPPARPAYERRGDGYAPGPRGYGAYGDDRPYRRPYPRQSSAWILPVVVGSAVAIGVLGFAGFMCIAIMNSRSSATPAGSSYYQPAPEPIDDPPFIPDAPPPPDQPVFVDPNPPVWVPPPDPPFIPDPNPPPDDK